MTRTPRDEEVYLFDVQGYLVVEDVLDHTEVAELSEIIDGLNLWEQAGWRRDSNFLATGAPHTLGEPFERLMAHPRLLPLIRHFCGGGAVRYDHGHIICMRRGSGALQLHGGGSPFAPDSYYIARDGAINSGLLAVAVSLVDASAEDGGFVCIPGSHKAAFPCPDSLSALHHDGPWLTHVPLRSGSAIIFTEALTHGTWRWTAEHERRAVFLKYTPAPLAYSGEYPTRSDTHSDDRYGIAQLLRRPYSVAGDSL